MPHPSGHRFTAARPDRQAGAALFTALVFLILMTLLAITASGTSIMQERMTGGLRNAQLGMMGSESTLRYAESYLWSLPSRTRAAKRLLFGCGSQGLIAEAADGVGCFTRNYGKIDPRVENFRSLRGYKPGATNSQVNGLDLTNLAGSEKTASLASQPRYIIEDLGLFRSQPFGNGGASGAPGGDGDPKKADMPHVYRITARSDGGNASVHRVTESTFVAQIPTSFDP